MKIARERIVNSWLSKVARNPFHKYDCFLSFFLFFLFFEILFILLNVLFFDCCVNTAAAARERSRTRGLQRTHRTRLPFHKFNALFSYHYFFIYRYIIYFARCGFFFIVSFIPTPRGIVNLWLLKKPAKTIPIIKLFLFLLFLFFIFIYCFTCIVVGRAGDSWLLRETQGPSSVPQI